MQVEIAQFIFVIHHSYGNFQFPIVRSIHSSHQLRFQSLNVYARHVTWQVDHVVGLIEMHITSDPPSLLRLIEEKVSAAEVVLSYFQLIIRYTILSSL